MFFCSTVKKCSVLTVCVCVVRTHNKAHCLRRTFVFVGCCKVVLFLCLLCIQCTRLLPTVVFVCHYRSTMSGIFSGDYRHMFSNIEGGNVRRKSMLWQASKSLSFV